MATTVNKLLAKARGEIGTKEQPRGSNKVKYNTAYYVQSRARQLSLRL